MAIASISVRLEDSIQNTFNDEFEQEMEQIVQNSVGTIMSDHRVAKSCRVTVIVLKPRWMPSPKMDNLGQDIEQQIESQSKGLEAKADRL